MIPRTSLPILLALVLTAGCQREAIRVYIAPKDQPVDASAPPTPTPQERSRPQLSWTLPGGWQQTDPGQVSVANFAIKTEAGEASVNITPLPNLEGKEALVVNMWREQVAQPPLSEAEIIAALTPVDVAGQAGQLFEIGGDGKRRIVTAMQHRGDTSWFFKLAGDESVVASQKPVFLEFLKSVRMKETSAP